MPTESYRTLNFFDWSGGIRDRRTNPLAFPQNALMAGENVEIVDRGLKTRSGMSLTSANSLPKGEVTALAQVRFPSNESSYLVAQCRDSGIAYEAPVSPNPPAQRVWHYTCYDPENNYLWVFGGRTPDNWPTGLRAFNDLWYFDCNDRTWHEVTNAVNHPSWCSWGNDMVYDPVEARLILYIGKTLDEHGQVIEAGNFWIAYSIGTNSWEYVPVDPESPFNWAGMSGWRYHCRLVLRERKIWMFGGHNLEGFFETIYLCTFDLTTHMYETIYTSYEGSGPGARSWHSLWYDAANDDVYMVGGRGYGDNYYDFWRLHVASTTWVQMPDLPLTEEASFQNGTLCGCNGKIYAIGTSEDPLAEWLSDVSWVYYNNEWTSCQFADPLRARSYTQGFIVGTDLLLCLGAVNDTDPETGSQIMVSGVEVLTDICEWTPTGGATLTTSRLYACKDHLPAGDAQFTEIYNLGEADRVSFAVLNDRVVITEGKAAPPLVWGGCMTDDGADWMSPKAVLVTQDGEHFYDVSAEVCDKDPASVADIGLISANGYLAVCTDMPKVEGFYFEMETANTVDTEDPGNQRTYETTLSSDNVLEIPDLKGTIVNWVQDSGSNGHFTDGSSNPLTLGPGNDCPAIESGLNVVFPSAEATIVSITNEGEGTGEVQLSGSYASQTIDRIVGVSAESGAITAGSGFSPVQSAWSKSSTYAFAGSGFSIRQIISADDITQGGGYFRISLKLTRPPGFQDLVRTYYNGVLRGSKDHPLAYTIAKKMYSMISRISIGERDGDSANTVYTPTPITFPFRPSWDSAAGDYSFQTHPSYAKTDDNGTLYLTVCAVYNIYSPFVITSDWIKFDIDENKDYILVIDFMDSWPCNYWRGNSVCRSDGAGYYFLSGEINAPETWNVADVSEYGFSFQDGITLAAAEIEVKDRYPLPEQMLVAYTNPDGMIDISSVEKLRIVSPSQQSPAGTHIYHAISLDGNETFQVFKSGAWRTFVREHTGIWQFLDGADMWNNASTNTLESALKEGFSITANQMGALDLQAITADDWTSEGGAVRHITQSLSFAVGMLCDSDYAPVVSSFLVTYNDAGDTAIQGYAGDKWTGGDGWTDGTRLDDVPWGKTGVVAYNGDTPFEAQYHVLNGVPGHWFRFKSNGTAEGTSITRVLYKAPCQALANIGDGQPDICLAAIFHDTSSDVKKDITLEVSGAKGAFTVDDDGSTTYVAGRATIPIQTADYLYIGYPEQFNQIEVEPYDGYPNAVDATLTGEYWNGKEWVALDMVDETVGSDENHPKTLSTTGRITWFQRSDWKMCIPINGNFPRGYYVRFRPSANLTGTTAIDELRVYPVPKALTKHKFAVAFRDRVALVGRPDAPDQVDISRALEEYGFTGADSGSYRVGGMDSIQCAVSAWNGLFLGKTETWHQLLGQTPENFAFESVEAARHIPLNSRVIVKAPVAGIDAGTRYGLFYINRFGAFVSTGMHTDTEWNTGRGAPLSDAVKWWDQGALPRLALDSLHKACGEYWPVKNWIVWAVPMITEEGQTSQPTNNRLIIFDVALGAWLPPFTISVASLTAAYHYNENAPGKLGEMGLYAGDYQGRIMRLFSPEDSTDLGQPISAWLETGWLHLGSPEWTKLVRRLQIYGQTTSGNGVTVKIWTDGNADPDVPSFALALEDLTEQEDTFFSHEEESFNVQGRFVKFRLEFQDVTQIFGIQIGTSLIREWGAS